MLRAPETWYFTALNIISMNHSHTFYHPQFTGDELVFVAFVVLMIEKSRSLYVEVCAGRRGKNPL